MTLEVSTARLRATLEDQTWMPADPLIDGELLQAIELLRELGSRTLPTNEEGVYVPEARPALAQLRARAVAIGEELTARLLYPPARGRLAAALASDEPPLLRLRVVAEHAGGNRSRWAARADRLLALPWELLRVDGRFPVEDQTLDMVREAVAPGVEGLRAPTQPLSIVATVAAPVDVAPLDTEGEMLSLWRALGARDEKRLVTTDLGTTEDLVAAIELYRPPAVHFTGHGRPGLLLFEDEAALARAVSVPDLVRELGGTARDQRLPTLIYLSACHGVVASPATETGNLGTRPATLEGSAGLAEMASTAAALHRAGFAQVVAYFGPVGDAQATRTAAAFYRGLSGGATARAALRIARTVAVEPLPRNDGVTRGRYPLGWAQLVLYHRGADCPTVLATPAPDSTESTARRRISMRIDRAGGARGVDGTVGVQQLRFGFIGRRWTRGEALRRWRAGQRVLVIAGLGGLGKSALCGELTRVLGHECPVLTLDGRFCGAQPRPIAALWREVLALYGDDASAQPVADPSGARLARAVSHLAQRAGGLVVYLDGAENLQAPPAPGKGLGRWRDDELRAWWHSLTTATTAGGRITLLASSRYRPEGTPAEAVLAIPPMNRWEILRLVTWMPTLCRLAREVREWLVQQVDGHPQTIVCLEQLLESARTSHPQRPFPDDWGKEALQPLLEQAAAALAPGMALEAVWEALRDEEREHLGRACTVAEPVPWEAVSMLGRTGASVRGLVDAGLLSPTQTAEGSWWAPHRLVRQTVSRRWQGDALPAHRRLGEWYQQRHRDDRSVLWARRAVDHLCRAGEADAAWPTAESLILHLRDLGRYEEAAQWAQRVLSAGPSGHPHGRAMLFHAQMSRRLGRFTTGLEECLERALELVDERERGSVLSELGALARARGHLPQAASYLQQAVEAAKDRHGEEHPAVAAALRALAGVLKEQGDLPAARNQLERALEIFDSVAQQSEKGACFHELATVLQAQGQIALAREVLERLLQNARSVLGTDEHPSVATALHSLAGILQSQGEIAGARQHIEHALGLKIRIFGTEHHPSVASSLHALASVLQAQGDVAGARKTIEHCLEVKREVFGTDRHPSVAASLHALAGVLQVQGDLSGARAALERALHIKAELFGTDRHPSVAVSLHALAGILQAQGDLADARGTIERTFEIATEVFGTERHPLVSAVRCSLAEVLRAEGDLAGAQEILERTLEVQNEVFGRQRHPSIAAAQQTLAGVLLERGLLAEARAMAERALELRIELLGTERHSDVAASLNLLAAIAQEQGDPALARQAIDRALTACAAVFGTERHPLCAASLHVLGKVLRQQGDIEGARRHLERSLEIKAELFGSDRHPQAAASLHEMGEVLHEAGRLEDARACLERSLELELEVFGDREHYSIAMTRMVLAVVHIEMGERSAGEKLLAQAHPALLAQLGPDHPQTRRLTALHEELRASSLPTTTGRGDRRRLARMPPRSSQS